MSQCIAFILAAKRWKMGGAEMKRAADRAQEIMTIMDGWSLGTVLVPTHKPADPGEDVRARITLNQAHVDALVESFRKTGVWTTVNISCVVRSNTLLQQRRAGVSVEDLVTAICAKGSDYKMETITGDHSRTAIQRIHSRFLADERFKKMPVKLFIIPETADANKVVMEYGVIDNTVASQHLKQNIADTLSVLRRAWEATGRQSLDMTAHAHLFGVKISAGAAAGWKSIATLDDDRWSRLVKIFSMDKILGDDGKLKVKPSKSYIWFTRYGVGLMPVPTQVALLDRILAGSMTCAMYEEACRDYKAEYELKKCLVAMAKEAFKNERNEVVSDSFSTLVEQHPKLDFSPKRNANFFQAYKTACWLRTSGGGLSFRVPEGFVATVKRILENYLKPPPDRNSGQIQVTSQFTHVHRLASHPLIVHKSFRFGWHSTLICVTQCPHHQSMTRVSNPHFAKFRCV